MSTSATNTERPAQEPQRITNEQAAELVMGWRRCPDSGRWVNSNGDKMKRFAPLYLAEDDLQLYFSQVTKWPPAALERYWTELEALLRARLSTPSAGGRHAAELEVGGLRLVAGYRIGDFSRAAVLTVLALGEQKEQ